MDNQSTFPQLAPMVQQGGLPELNVAATCVATQALGPGLRSVVWVQGCPFHCAGCIAPGWIPIVEARRVDPQTLVDELLQNNSITGLTFSGGEPMLQAAGLTAVIRLARKRRPDLSLICYTGFTLEKLLTGVPFPGVNDLLEECDVLIDGVYVAARNDNRGLRGSSNQRIHHLSGRMNGYDFEDQPRKIEVRLVDGFAQMVGVPPVGFGSILTDIVEKAQTPRVVGVYGD